MDELIKDGLAKRLSGLRIEKTDACPTEAVLLKYLEGTLSKAEEKSVAEHTKGCYWCIEQLHQAQRAASSLSRRRSIMRNLAGWIKKNRWLLGAGTAFGLSFIFSRYFFQFLILTLLMGIKWIFATGTSKTVVMIYDAWKRKTRENTRNRLYR